MRLHFLYKPGVARTCAKLAIVVLLLTVVAEFFIPLHAHFSIADFFAFNVLFGFCGCAAMIVFAKLLGKFIKRPDTYYERHDDE